MGQTGGRSDPPANPMPPLLAAVREALTESIRAHGVIVPVVKDQTGYVLDGNNRITIAADLDVPVAEVVYECEPEQREILAIELNGARRQIGLDEWRPLVDHLRAQTTGDGVRRFSDRVIATAVGVSRDAVKRYKSLDNAGGASAPPAQKSVGQDGKVQVTGGAWTARDRVLHLIRQSTDGLTGVELLGDSVLREFGEGTIRRLPGSLRDEGLVIAAGKRAGSTIWKAAPVASTAVEASPAADPAFERKVDRVMTAVGDPQLRAAIRDELTTSKQDREVARLLREVEKEEEALRLAQEKREAENDKQRLRVIEVARSQAEKSIMAWDVLIDEVRNSWVMIATYSKVFDDLPAIHPSFCRMLDREIVELRQQLDWFERRLHPPEEPTLHRDTVIDL